MNGKTLFGLLAGMAIGATLGILFAPEKGSKTRKKLISKGDEYMGSVKEKINGLLESISSEANEIEKETEKLVEKEYDNMEKKASY